MISMRSHSYMLWFLEWRRISEQTRDDDPMLAQRWSSVCNAGPALSKHWVIVSCLLGAVLSYEQHLFLTLRYEVTFPL